MDDTESSADTGEAPTVAAHPEIAALGITVSKEESDG